MGKSVSEAQRDISSDEFTNWVAYYEIEPFGEWRADRRQSFTSAILANAHRRKGSRHSSPKDFMWHDKDDGVSNLEAMHAVFRNYVSAHNAIERDKQKRAG